MYKQHTRRNNKDVNNFWHKKKSLIWVYDSRNLFYLFLFVCAHALAHSHTHIFLESKVQDDEIL